MKRALSRTDFNSSRLIRFLSDVSVVDTSEPRQAFAERLGEWLDFSDAITLHAALHWVPTKSPAVAAKGRSAARTPVEEDLARTRTELASSITANCSPGDGEARIKLPVPTSGASVETAAAYEPFLRFQFAHQSEMEASIGTLRKRVRAAITGASAELGRLAALDAALDTILATRERQVLSRLALLLENRFEQLFKAHRRRLAENGTSDDPGLWLQHDGWLRCFCKELQGALLAELDLRLQPTLGLIEAFSNKVNTH